MFIVYTHLRTTSGYKIENRRQHVSATECRVNGLESSNQLDQPCCQTCRSAVHTTSRVPGI